MCSISRSIGRLEFPPRMVLRHLSVLPISTHFHVNIFIVVVVVVEIKLNKVLFFFEQRFPDKN